MLLIKADQLDLQLICLIFFRFLTYIEPSEQLLITVFRRPNWPKRLIEKLSLET